MDIFLLYLFTRVDDVRHALDFITLLCFMGSGMCMLAASSESWMKGRVMAFWLMAAFVVFGGLRILVPSQKDLAIIAGGYLTIQASQSDTAKKVYSIVTDILDDKIAEIAKRKAKQ